VDPVVSFPWRITREHNVATAGSCFAQHIARHLKDAGFNYFVAESGHPIGDDATKSAFNYGTFTARYGNIYTAKQLLQTFNRAFQKFTPVEAVWPLKDGGFADPFRPAIQPHGFACAEEVYADREQHLAAVRRMFSELDIFVFTLGLTEAWRSREDGAVFPVCPGVHGGEFDSERYEFVNYDSEEVISDLSAVFDQLRDLNPSAKVILTVSPVPLIATAEDRHVLVSTTYSKSALRVACERLVKLYDNVAYFPSYEIITGAYTRGKYFAEDLRSVTEQGVSHVMRLFLEHATIGFDGASAPIAAAPVSSSDSFLQTMSSIVKTTCEEELLEAAVK
jgi:hypothetical protein